MDENIVERAIVPHNPAQAKVLQKEKYDLFAPIAKNGQAGMAKFDKGAFLIKDGEVYLHKDAIVKLVSDAFAKLLRCDMSTGGLSEFNLRLKSPIGDTLSTVNIKLDAYLGITEPNAGARDWLTIKLTATDDTGRSYPIQEQVLLPITKIRDLRFVQQDETDEYKLVLEYLDAVDQAIKTVEVDVPEYPIATSSKAGVVKVAQGSFTNIGITDGLICVLKATEAHIAARGADYTDYVLTASKTNAIVKAALTDKKKMALADNEKAKARETLGAASTEDVNGMHLALSMDDDFKLTVSLLNTNNEVISASNEIDLPLEEMIVSGKVSDDGEKIILTLKNSETIEFAVSALVGGLAKQEDLDELKEKFENQEVPKIELAPTLEGYDTDKAPSVQAVNAELANALKCEKSGASVVLTDISPITHPLKVSVEGVEDPSSVKVLVLRNLFNPDDWVGAKGRVTINSVEYLNVLESGNSYYKFPGDSSVKYAFHWKFIRNSAVSSHTNAILINEDGSTSVTMANVYPGETRTLTVYGGQKFYFSGYGRDDICIDLRTAQLYATSDQETVEYSVNEDGIVNGIFSRYPCMMLTTNSKEASITCEYNRDVVVNVNKKLDKIETVSAYMRAYVADKDGTSKTIRVTDAVIGETVVQRRTDAQVWVPEDPNYKNSATSKKYVDDTTAAIRAELGKQVFTVSQGQYSSVAWLVPNGALPNFYLETTLFEYSYEVDGVYGENFAKANFTELTFYDENDNVLDTKPATSQTFYEMPSGTAKIEHDGVYLDYNPPWDYSVMHLPNLKFQVKVGA